MDTIRWGIAGTGRIAGTVATDLVTVPGTELVAVGSRVPDRAQEFADRFGGGRGLAYADLITDDEVDAIYLATPHPQHRQLAVAALRAGKAVLVEKAFTATLAGARDVVATARETGVFCMEAMWTRFQPAIAEIRTMVADGALGEVRRVEADLGAYREFNAADRLFDPALGGGALLDLGVYPVSFAQHFLGDPEVVHTHGSLFPNGADADFSMLLGFSGGRSAALAGGLRSDSAGRAVVVGTDGWVDVLPRFHHASRLVVHRRGEEPREVHLPPTGRGYTHEIVEVNTCLREGRSESQIMPLSDTLAVMRILDEGCRQLGVSYAEDDSLLARTA